MDIGSWPDIVRKMYLTMKICVCMLILGLSTLSARTHSQIRLTLDAKNKTLPEVFQEITRLSGYEFMYSSNELRHVGKVSVQLEDRDLSDILAECLKNTGLWYRLEDDVIVISPKLAAPQEAGKELTVTGTVKDKGGMPLPGVTILLKGTQLGVVTDVDGKFRLTLPGNTEHVLIFSFVGMKTREIKVNDAKPLTVVMKEDVTEMDEVVVTGYQTISKERATGAYSIINAKELEQKPTANISSALNGLVPGLTVQSSPVEGTTRFVIRGQGTLGDPNKSNQEDIDPLVVVDGFPISGYGENSDPFATINPNDVESITVLKDAAATSIYGARAANGVIVITTKKGKAGSKLDISADAYWSVSSRADLDYAFNMASAESQFRFVELMKQYDAMTGMYMAMLNPYAIPSYRKYYMPAPYQLLFEQMQGNLTADQYEAEKKRLIDLGNRGVWKDDLNEYIFRHALRSQYNVALRGTTDRLNYSFSASYDDEKGVSKGNDNQRVMLNMATSAKLTKNLTFDVALNSSFAKRHNNGTSVETLKSYISPWSRLVDDEGRFTHIATSSTVYEPIIDGMYDGKTDADWHYNPVSDRQYIDNEAKTMNYRVQGGFGYSTTWGLNVSAKGQYEWRRYTDHQGYDAESYFVRDLYNTYSTLNPASGMYSSYFPKGGIFSDGGHVYESYNLRGQADYTLNRDKHVFTVLAGTEIISSTTETTPTVTRYGYNKYTNAVLSQPDYVTFTPNIFGQPAQMPYAALGSLSSMSDRFFSVYANAAYTYDDKYSLTASFRTDASNFQAESQRDKFSPFWSVGAGWLLSKETFMENASRVDLLKLRASVGIAGVAAGKSGTSSVTTLRTYPGNINFTNNESYNTIATRGNETLTWEKSRTVNIGLDASLWGRKLSGSVEFYNKYSYDVLSDATVPAISQGVTRSKFNNAEVLNRGVELSVASDLRIAGDLKWRGTLNYAFNHNEVKKYNLKGTYPVFAMHGYVEGYPVDFIAVMNPVGYTPEGLIILQGKDGEQDVILDMASSHFTDQIDRDNETVESYNWSYYLGTSTPKSNLSFSNQFTWKGLTLSFMITGRFGYYVAPMDFVETSSATYASYSKKLDESFAVYDEGYANQKGYSAFPLYNEENYQSYMQGGGWGYGYARNSVLSFRNSYIAGDHIRLNEIYLGYDLPERLLARQSIFQRVNIYAQASNLGLIWSKNGKMDPDYPVGNLKPLPTFTFGLKIGFKNW